MRNSPHSPRRRGAPFVLAAAIAVLAALLPAAPAAALPGNFWGVVPQAPPTAEQLLRLKRGGVDSIRVPILWNGAQPVRGAPLDFSASDEIVRNAAAARLEILPTLSGAPTWAVPEIFVDRRHGVKAPRSLPVRNGVQRSGWRSFLRQAALRYGPGGSFWAENPQLPRRPIRVWQIWNEPNFMYFVARPNPAEYGKLVKQSFAALRSVDGGARVVLGGLFSRPKQATFRRGPRLAYFASDFLHLMYRRTPGVKRRFHGIAVHPYTANFKRYVPYIEEVRRVLRQHRDAGKGLYLTEVGWSSGPRARNNSFAKGRAGQAAQLKGAFRLVRKMQRRWRVQRLYWFSIDDQPGSCNFCDGSGLFADGFRPKPSWFAYVRFAGGRAR